jgi:hypothetical protein
MPPEGDSADLRRSQPDVATTRSVHETDRVYLTPVTLLSFHLQGLAPSGDPDSSPSPILPCRWNDAEAPPVGFEGLIPPERPHEPAEACPHGVPSWRSPL